jgi:hypothetical protein
MHGDERVYTWYSHKNNCFRLDQAFLNPEMMPALQMIGYEWGSSLQEPVRRDELSDHAAIILDLDLSRLD